MINKRKTREHRETEKTHCLFTLFHIFFLLFALLLLIWYCFSLLLGTVPCIVYGGRIRLNLFSIPFQMYIWLFAYASAQVYICPLICLFISRLSVFVCIFISLFEWVRLLAMFSWAYAKRTKWNTALIADIFKIEQYLQKIKILNYEI